VVAELIEEATVLVVEAAADGDIDREGRAAAVTSS
jgi:hypothetical protein